MFKAAKMEIDEKNGVKGIVESPRIRTTTDQEDTAADKITNFSKPKEGMKDKITNISKPKERMKGGVGNGGEAIDLANREEKQGPGRSSSAGITDGKERYFRNQVKCGTLILFIYLVLIEYFFKGVWY